jgi:hypothetical protein
MKRGYAYRRRKFWKKKVNRNMDEKTQQNSKKGEKFRSIIVKMRKVSIKI